MNRDMFMSATSSTSSEFQLYPSSPETHEILRPTTLHFPNAHPITTVKPHQWQNPRKKRTKVTRVESMKAIVGGSSSGIRSTKPKSCVKTPDPNAPKITRPCTECGKTFWSLKALFGHMRCHPERPWRGINPPSMVDHGGGSTLVTTNEDRYVASCLLMLANGTRDYDESGHPGWFECTSCKKVFRSHQALGGHRASHKNVKGCFAITQKEGDEEGELGGDIERTSNMMMVVGSSSSSEHKCSICLRVFSSGQALGGHKRCHWEKEDDHNNDGVAGASTSIVSESLGEYRVDLNLPAPVDQDYTRLGLDLRLGL